MKCQLYNTLGDIGNNEGRGATSRPFKDCCSESGGLLSDCEVEAPMALCCVVGTGVDGVLEPPVLGEVVDGTKERRLGITKCL
jgi:hypothetical protein